MIAVENRALSQTWFVSSPSSSRSAHKMESMLNKLKSTVTKVTADVTSAVMGNPVTREFEVGRHIASGGPGLCWRIYNGTKKSTKQVCLTFPLINCWAVLITKWFGGLILMIGHTELSFSSSRKWLCLCSTRKWLTSIRSLRRTKSLTRWRKVFSSWPDCVTLASSQCSILWRSHGDNAHQHKQITSIQGQIHHVEAQ